MSHDPGWLEVPTGGYVSPFLQRDLATIRRDLRREVGEMDHKDGNWQPMVSAREIRQLLDALDQMEKNMPIHAQGGGPDDGLELDTGTDYMEKSDGALTIQPVPTDVWVCLKTGNYNVTGPEFDPGRLTRIERSIIRGLVQAALDSLED